MRGVVDNAALAGKQHHFSSSDFSNRPLNRSATLPFRWSAAPDMRRRRRGCGGMRAGCDAIKRLPVESRLLSVLEDNYISIGSRANVSFAVCFSLFDLRAASSPAAFALTCEQFHWPLSPSPCDKEWPVVKSSPFLWVWRAPVDCLSTQAPHKLGRRYDEIMSQSARSNSKISGH